MKLNVGAFAFACGLTWGILVFVLTWWFILFGESAYNFLMIGEFTRGYSSTPMGSLIALHWGFFDGFVSGALFSWLYNLLSDRLTKKEP